VLRGSLLVLVCACHGDAKPAAPEQSKHDALVILCTFDGVPGRVTNKEVRHLIDGFADEHPWEIEKQILQLARDAGLSQCHPLDVLTNIRAHNGVDVPLLADDRSTVPLDPGRTFAITAAGVAIEDAGTFRLGQLDDLGKYAPLVDGPIAARFAVDRAVNVHTFARMYDACRRAGVHDIELLVTTPTETRAVVLDAPKAAADGSTPQTVAVVSVGARIELAGKVMTPNEMRAAFAGSAADRVFIVAEPTVPMQRLADVIALVGGHATLGDFSMPAPVPSPR
jgi:biopolymer transport protein ExbD